MAEFASTFKDLPVDQIEQDPDQPRKDLAVQADDTRLQNSLREIGMQQPIVVLQIDDKRYKIIDGHRRHIAAKELGFKTVPCRIFKKLPKGELERLRFEIQNNRREWKPLERSDALERIKTVKGFTSNRELAECLGVSETLIHFSLQLRKQTLEYIGLMEKYELPETYRYEFMSLKPKIRKIKNFEVSDITTVLFKKAKHGVIKTAKSFRKLKKIFLRAHLNEKELCEFLADPDMTVDDLLEKTVQSGPSLLVEKLLIELGKIFQKGADIAAQDEATFMQLRDFLVKKFPFTKTA